MNFRQDVEANRAREILRSEAYGETQGAPAGAPCIRNFRNDSNFYPQVGGL